MDLMNKQVIHKSFGGGIVIENTDSYIKVSFASGIKSFVFPYAFGSYLTLNDKETNDTIKLMIKEKEIEHEKTEIELQNKRVLKDLEQQRILQREKFLKTFKIHNSSQAAFWCDDQELNKVFNEWRVFTGVINNGKNEGKPNRLIRLNQNSAVLLTSRDPSMSEKDRCIIGVYMVNEDFNGRLCDDGYVTAHSKYRLRLLEQESEKEKMLFWNYYTNEKYPNNMTWKTGKYRYIDNVIIAQILRDIISLKRGSSEKELAVNFFDYFCKMNKIVKKDLPEPNGAMM